MYINNKKHHKNKCYKSKYRHNAMIFIALSLGTILLMNIFIATNRKTSHHDILNIIQTGILLLPIAVAEVIFV
jgi:hypothetical protein